MRMTADGAVATAIDLRSDTVTRPAPDAMRRAMAEAVVGDDSYREDPTVAELEARSAAELGMATGLFLPTGTMGNLCAAMAQTQRGDEVILEADAHILRLEQGGFAVLAGLSSRALPGARGRIPLDALEAAFDTVGPARPRAALLCLETSHNTAGGAVLPLDYLAAGRRPRPRARRGRAYRWGAALQRRCCAWATGQRDRLGTPTP